MHRFNNFAIVCTVIKRCLSESSFKGNKHYTFCVKHIKTELNNHSYIVKKTTAIPKEICYFSTINYGNIVSKQIEMKNISNNPTLCKTDYLRFKITDNIVKKMKEEELYLQDLINKLISPTKVNRNYSFPSYSNDILNVPNNFLLKNKDITSNQENIDPITTRNTNVNTINFNSQENIKVQTFEKETNKLHSSFKCETDRKYIEADLYNPLNDTNTVGQLKKASSFINLNDFGHSPVRQNDYTCISSNCIVNKEDMKRNINCFSMNELKELVSKKVMDLMLYNLKLNEISPDNILVLNPGTPQKKTLVYFKDKSIHIIEPPNIDFDQEIKNYIKKLVIAKNRDIETERLNLISFEKTTKLKSSCDKMLQNNCSSPSKVFLSEVLPFSLDNISEFCSLENTSYDQSKPKSKEDLDSIVLMKVQKSLSLENNTEKFWIPYEDENNGSSNENGFASIAINCDGTAENIKNDESGDANNFSWFQSNKELCPKSGPPFTDKIPVNKDKLIEDTVVPNTSILNIINSIDKSAVIIQKDLYITDQIIQKIQKEEEKEKQKVIDKNKLQSSGSKETCTLHLNIHSLKDGKITLSLSELISDTNKMFIKSNQHENVESTNYMQNISEIKNNTENKNMNDVSACFEKKASHCNANKYTTLSDSQQNPNNFKNCNTELTKTNLKIGEMVSNKQINDIIINEIEESRWDAHQKTNQTYISKNNEKNESALGDEIDLFCVQNEICLEDNKNQEPRENSLKHTEELNSFHCLLSENGKQVNNSKENEELKNKQCDVSIFLTLQSIDDDGNMIFNLIDKAGRVVSNLSSLSNDQYKIEETIQTKSNNISEKLLNQKLSKNPNLENSKRNKNHDHNIVKDKDMNFHIFIPAQSKFSEKDCHKKNMVQQKIIEIAPECQSKTPHENHSINECMMNETKLSEQKELEDYVKHKKNSHVKMNDTHLFSDFNSCKKDNIKEPYNAVKDRNYIKEDIPKENSQEIKNTPETLSCDTTDFKLKAQDNLQNKLRKISEPMKSNQLLQDCSSIVDNSVKCLLNVNNNNNIKKWKTNFPKEKKFGSSTTNSSSTKSVDHIKKTTISTIKKNDYTDIKISEVETFVDPRLPIPFSTETFFQIFGSNSSLKNHSALIDIAKFKLTSSKKVQAYPTNMDVMTKLDDIQKSVQKLNMLTVSGPLSFSKNDRAVSKSLIPSTEITPNVVNNQGIAKNNTSVKVNKTENLPDNKNKIIDGRKVRSDFMEKISLRTDKQTMLPVKTTHFKETGKKKLNRLDRNITFEIKKKDKKESLNQENKSLLVVKESDKTEKLIESPKNNIKNTKKDKLKSVAEIKKTAIASSNKISQSNYIDLFNIYKSEKETKKLKFNIPQKSIYDHNGLSKRDRKILREITKEIPKQKTNRKRSKRRPFRATINKKSVKEFLKQPTKSQSKEHGSQKHDETSKQIPDTIKLPIKTMNATDKSNDLVVKTNTLSNYHSENKNKNLTPIKQENKETKISKRIVHIDGYKNKTNINDSDSLKAKPRKIVTDFSKPVKFDSTSNKALPKVANKPIESNNGMWSMKKETKDNQQLPKSAEKNINSDSKSISAEFIERTTKPKQTISHRKLSQKSAEMQNNKIKDNLKDEKCSKKTLCHTYIATEAYINQPEKCKTIPDKSFSFPTLPKIIEKSPPQKVTIVEKYNKRANDDSANNLEIQEGFKQDLIKKSQAKIEHKTNIDFRVRTPKIKNPKSKVTILKPSSQKEKASTIIGSNRIPQVKKETNKKYNTENKPLTPKKSIRNKIVSTDFAKRTSLSPKHNNTNKQESVAVKTIRKEEPGKKGILKQDSEIPHKELVLEIRNGFKKKYNTKHDSAISQKQPALVKKDESNTKDSTKHVSGKFYKELLERKEESNKKDSSNQDGMHYKEITPEKKEEPVKNDFSIHDSTIPHNQISLEPNSKPIEVTSIKPMESPAVEKEKKPNKNIENLKTKIVENKTDVPQTIVLEPVTVPSVNGNKRNFPMLLIDVDKMSKEIKPELDLKNCQKCTVANERIIDFPLQNPQKRLTFPSSSRILSLAPSKDPILRKELNYFPSVTKVLNTTIPENSREILREWRRNMIKELGENGFKLFYKGELTNGSKFHSQLHDHLLNGTNTQNHSSNLSMKSIQNVLRRLTDLRAVNSHVVHRKLAYRGVLDCIAKYQNRPVLIEWKRLENPQVKVDDSSFSVASLQLSAYTGAVNYDDAYKFQLSGGLIVVAYNDGSEAEVIEINKDQCLKHWKEWLKRLQKFQDAVHKKQN